MLLVVQLHDNNMIYRLFVKVRCRLDFEQYYAASALLIFPTIAALSSSKIEQCVKQKRRKTTEQRNDHTGDKVVDCGPANEGGEHEDCNNKTYASVYEEIKIAGHDMPICASEDPASSYGVME